MVLLELHGPEPGAVFSLESAEAVVGRRGAAEVPLDDATVSWEHARFTATKDALYVEDLASRNGTFVNGQPVRERARVYDGDYVRFGGSVTLKFSLMDAAEEAAHRGLFEATLRDPLTRLYNRRYFDERLLAELAFASGRGMPLAVLLIDVDHFTQLNDELGRPYGDAILKLVAGSAQKLMRPADLLARYGGDELVVLAPATSLRNAQILSERLRQRIIDLDLRGLSRGVTVSVGVVCAGSGLARGSAEELLRAAELALLEAKQRGPLASPRCRP